MPAAFEKMHFWIADKKDSFLIHRKMNFCCCALHKKFEWFRSFRLDNSVVELADYRPTQILSVTLLKTRFQIAYPLSWRTDRLRLLYTIAVEETLLIIVIIITRDTAGRQAAEFLNEVIFRKEHLFRRLLRCIVPTCDL